MGYSFGKESTDFSPVCRTFLMLAGSDADFEGKSWNSLEERFCSLPPFRW
jgi:hypothetical protein